MGEIENTDEIEMFIHCTKCVREYKADDEINSKLTPKDYADTQAGWTIRGIQIWCNRHDCNILHIDFEGTKHPANTTAKKQ